MTSADDDRQFEAERFLQQLDLAMAVVEAACSFVDALAVLRHVTADRAALATLEAARKADLLIANNREINRRREVEETLRRLLIAVEQVDYVGLDEDLYQAALSDARAVLAAGTRPAQDAPEDKA